jgi:hypothetical protein
VLDLFHVFAAKGIDGCSVDGELSRIASGKPVVRVKTGGDGRLFVEAVLWITRTDSPWRDLSTQFGQWKLGKARSL